MASRLVPQSLPHNGAKDYLHNIELFHGVNVVIRRKLLPYYMTEHSEWEFHLRTDLLVPLLHQSWCSYDERGFRAVLLLVVFTVDDVSQHL